MSATAPSIRIWIGLSALGVLEDYDINNVVLTSLPNLNSIETE